MKRIIHYNQTIPQYDGEYNVISSEKVYLIVTSDNDHDFGEQLAAVKSYCDDWTVEELLDDEKQQTIQKTKDWLDDELSKGMIYTDGKKYTVTKEKQALLQGELLYGNMLKESGIPIDDIILNWNYTGGECTEWKMSDLAVLAMTIRGYVKPLVSKQQKAETQINEAINNDEIQAILKDFI